MPNSYQPNDNEIIVPELNTTKSDHGLLLENSGGKWRLHMSEIKVVFVIRCFLSERP